MIPLRDVIPSRTTPYVTIGLVAVNALVFLYELTLGDTVDSFTLYYGLVPVTFSWVAVFTSMFLHGGYRGEHLGWAHRSSPLPRSPP